MNPIEVFRPNNHSQWRISYKPVAEHTEELISRIARENFLRPASQMHSVKQVDETEIASNNFQVIFSYGHEKRKMLIRRYPGKSDLGFIREVLNATKFLGLKGQKVPNVISNNQGSPITVFDNTAFVAFDFIDGDHFRCNVEEIRSVGREMAELNIALRKYPDQEVLDVLKNNAQRREAYLFNREIWIELLGIAKERKAHDDDFVYGLLLEHGGLILDSVDVVASLPFSPKQVVHYDLHPHNMITDGRVLSSFLDMDSLMVWERIKSVSFAVHRLSKQFVVNAQSHDIRLDIKRAKNELLDAYTSVDSLTIEELSNIGLFILNEGLRRLTYVTKDFLIKGNLAWKNNRELEKQIASIMEAGYFS